MERKRNAYDDEFFSIVGHLQEEDPSFTALEGPLLRDPHRGPRLLTMAVGVLFLLLTPFVPVGYGSVILLTLGVLLVGTPLLWRGWTLLASLPPTPAPHPHRSGYRSPISYPRKDLP